MKGNSKVPHHECAVGVWEAHRSPGRLQLSEQWGRWSGLKSKIQSGQNMQGLQDGKEFGFYSKYYGKLLASLRKINDPVLLFKRPLYLHKITRVKQED